MLDVKVMIMILVLAGLVLCKILVYFGGVSMGNKIPLIRVACF